MSDTSGHINSPYETNEQRLECENKQLKTRVAELAEHKRHTENIMSDVSKLNDLLGVYDLCQVVAAVEKWQKRIAELEAAQQWHPASEPPMVAEWPNSRNVETQIKDGTVITNRFSVVSARWEFSHSDVLRWRDLPPMPEGGV